MFRLLRFSPQRVNGKNGVIDCKNFIDKGFKTIPEEKWDAYIDSISSFNGWELMLSEAMKEWVGKQLGFQGE
jgi:hypothetical protein